MKSVIKILLVVFPLIIGEAANASEEFHISVSLKTNIPGLDLKKEYEDNGLKDLILSLTSEDSGHIQLTMMAHSNQISLTVYDEDRIEIYSASTNIKSTENYMLLASSKRFLDKHYYSLKSELFSWLGVNLERKFSEYLDVVENVKSPEGLWVDGEGLKYLCFRKENDNTIFEQYFWVPITSSYNKYEKEKYIEVLRPRFIQFKSLRYTSSHSDVIVTESDDYFDISRVEGFGAYSSLVSTSYIRILPSGNRLVDKEKTESVLRGSGTCFLVNSNGLVATNYHVVEDASEMKVLLNSVEYDAILYKKDPGNDLAILQLVGFGTFPDAPIVVSSIYQMAESVFVLGFPRIDVLGNEMKYTEGSITSLSGIRDEQNKIQHSVPIQPGNSGSPLFNSKGEIVGVVVATLNPFSDVKNGEGSLPQNVNYAIKSDYLKILIGPALVVEENNELETLKRTDQVEVLKKLVGLIKVY